MRILSGILALIFLNHPAWAGNPTKRLQRIAFGSCNRQHNQQPLWRDLIQKRPDLFIWAGDNVYADSKNPRGIQAAYQMQEQVEDYALFKSMVPIIGTWDDHDFSYNNASGDYPHKAQSQQYFLDFLDEHKLSPRRFQEGIYTSHLYGRAPEQIKIILLDNRYFKDLDPAAPLLGQPQWEWLEKELAASRASLHFIVGGLSFFAPKLPFSEEWEDYPQELNRLMQLMHKYRPKGLVFLSGDKHFGTIFSRFGFLEFMSSGMTHVTRIPLRPYVRQKYENPLFQMNYGLIDVEWNGSNPQLTLSLQDRHGLAHQTTHVWWQEDKWVEANTAMP
jgi:alkaline phosphatase D